MGPFSSSPFLAQRPSPFRHTVRTLGPFDRTMCRDTFTCAVHFVCTVHSLFAHRPSPFWHIVGTLGPFDVNMWIRAVERHCPLLGNMWKGLRWIKQCFCGIKLCFRGIKYAADFSSWAHRRFWKPFCVRAQHNCWNKERKHWELHHPFLIPRVFPYVSVEFEALPPWD